MFDGWHEYLLNSSIFHVVRSHRKSDSMIGRMGLRVTEQELKGSEKFWITKFLSFNEKVMTRIRSRMWKEENEEIEFWFSLFMEYYNENNK